VALVETVVLAPIAPLEKNAASNESVDSWRSSIWTRRDVAGNYSFTKVRPVLRPNPSLNRTPAGGLSPARSVAG